MTTASVIVPTHDKRDRLLVMLACFAYQEDVDFEVVVCDDGSTDGTGDALRAIAPSLPFPLIVTAGPRAGAAAARNRAVAAATGDVLVFNDDDMVPAYGFLAHHIAACKADDVLSRGERWAVPVHAVPAFLAREVDRSLYASLWAAARMTVAEGWTLDALSAQPEHGFRYLQTCTSNLAMRRASFAAVGGFEESFGTRWGAEDTELGYRAQLVGISLRLTAAAKNLHLEHSMDSGEKFARGLHNFRRLTELHPESKGLRALVSYVEMAVERGHAGELFDEQSFVDRVPPAAASIQPIIPQGAHHV